MLGPISKATKKNLDGEERWNLNQHYSGNITYTSLSNQCCKEPIGLVLGPWKKDRKTEDIKSSLCFSSASFPKLLKSHFS
jgi:hypothetical protein